MQPIGDGLGVGNTFEKLGGFDGRAPYLDHIC